MNLYTGAVHNEIFLKTEACPNTLRGLQMTCSADIATNVKPNLTVFQSTDIRGAQNKALFFFFSC